MFKPMRRAGVLASVLAAATALAAGCASPATLPLDPAAELAALDRPDLDGLAAEHALPGDPSPAEPGSFDPANSLDERELVAVALARNPELQARRLEAGRAWALLLEAGLWPNPELGVAWQPGLGSASGTVAGADLLFELLAPGVRAARVAAAAAGVDAAAAGMVAAEWRLVREVRLGRLDVLGREHEAALLDEEVALRERAVELAERRQALGVGTELEVSAARLDLARVRRDRRLAGAGVDEARQRLNRVLGLPPGHALRLAGAGEPLAVTPYRDLDDAELERRLLAGRFELRALEAAFEQAEQELRLARAERTPGLRLGPALEREADGGDYGGVAASVELPLFDRGQGAMAAAANRRDRARADYRAALHTLRAEAHQARARLRQARREVQAGEDEVLPLVRRHRELFEAAFGARQVDVMDLLVAQQRSFEARRAHLDALLRYQAAVIELEAALGEPPAVERKSQ